MRGRSWTGAVLAVVLVLLTAGCSTGNGDRLRIGVLSPFSGANAAGGLAMLEGYQIAADEINARGGIGGRQVELVKGDATTAADGIAQVNRLAGTVEVFLGTYVSAVSATASSMAARYDMLYWDTNATADELTQRGLPNFVRTGPAATQFGERSSSFIVDSVAPALGRDPAGLTVFLTHENSVYGSSIASVQKKALAAAGVQVVGESAYPATSADLSNTVLAGQQANPDVWLQTGYIADTNLLLRTAQQQGFRPRATVLTGTGDISETLDAVGAATLEGVYVVSYPHDDIAASYGPGAAQFRQAYETRFGHPPVYPQTMTAYVGMLMLADALSTAGSTRPDAVRKAAAAVDRPLSTYATGYGERYDAQFQNTRSDPTVVQWRGGRTVTVFPEAAIAQVSTG